MDGYYSLRVIFSFVLAFGSLPKSSVSQTYCSLKFQVPNMDYCDRSGLLEEEVTMSVYQTKGNIEGVQDYQTETFQLFDQQLTSIIEGSDPAEGTIRDIQVEIKELADLLSNIQAAQALDTALSGDQHARAKRAVTSTQLQLQQTLNAAKLTFQQAMADVTRRLQNLTTVLDGKAKQMAATHAKFQADLTTHKQSLTQAEQDLQTIDADIQSLITSGNTGPGGLNISGLTSDVTDLLINATVAEQIHERQLDTAENLIQNMEADEAKLSPEIQRMKSELTTADSDLTKAESSIATSKGAVRIVEDQLNQALYNATNDLATARAQIAANKAAVTSVGNEVVRVLTTTGQFSRDLKQYRTSVDGVQSVVTFSKNAQNQQSGQILTMNKVTNDNIKVMQYAFGLLTTRP